MKKFLKKHCVEEELAVVDKKLGGIVQEKLGINCVYRLGVVTGSLQALCSLATASDVLLVPSVMQQCHPGAYAWHQESTARVDQVCMPPSQQPGPAIAHLQWSVWGQVYHR